MIDRVKQKLVMGIGRSLACAIGEIAIRESEDRSGHTAST